MFSDKIELVVGIVLHLIGGKQIFKWLINENLCLFLKMGACVFIFTTFVSQGLIFEEKTFLPENVSNLTHEFLYDKFNKKIFC